MISIGIGLWGSGLTLAQRITAIFSTGTNGYIYDYFPASNLNQLSTGTTPVTAVTQPVGLSLDKHASDGRGVVNLLTYTEDFSNAVWEKGKVSVIANSVTAPDGTLTADKAVITTGNGMVQLNENITLVIGTTYTFSVYAKKGELTYVNLGAIYNVSNYAGTQFDLNTGTVLLTASAGAGYLASNATITAVSDGYYLCKVNITVGIANAFFNSGPSNTVWASGDLAQTMTGDGTSGIYLWGAQLEVGSTATAYQVNTNSIGGPGNHAIQATAAARPTWTNRVNLLTYSEDFSNAAWTKRGAVTVTPNSTVAPDGTTTADTINNLSTDGVNDIYNSTGSSIPGISTASFYIKRISTSGVLKFKGGSSGICFTVDLALLSDGWEHITPSHPAFTHLADIDNILYYQLIATSPVSFHIWGAQLERGSTATRYQRVTTATDFDTVGFPYYLSFLGTDDSLSSATGGGGTAGFFWCGAVLPTGGAGTFRSLLTNNGSTTGYAVFLDDANKLSLYAGNGSAWTICSSTATVNVGTKYMCTVWDDGVNLSVQLNEVAAQTIARPVVVAGTAGYTIGKSNASATYFFIGNLYASVYAKDTGLTAAQRASVQAWVKSKAGL